MNCPKCDHIIEGGSIHRPGRFIDTDLIDFTINENGVIDMVIEFQCPECLKWTAIAIENVEGEIIE